MSGVTFKGKVGGLDEVKAMLKGLPEQVQRRVIRPALTKATKPMLLAARRLAPRETRALSKSLVRIMRTYVKTGTILAVIAPKQQETLLLVRTSSYSQKPQKVNPKFYAHLVHGGTRPHTLKKGDKLARSGAMARAANARGQKNLARWEKRFAEIGVLPNSVARQKERSKLLDRIYRHRERQRIRKTEKQTQGAGRHPGTRPNRFLVRAFAQTRREVQTLFVAEVRAGIPAALAKAKKK